jgi:uncharacterized membrane protein
MNDIFKGLIAIVIMLALLPIIQAFVAAVNTTGMSAGVATLLGLIPFFWVLATVGVAVILAVRAYK